jgi:glycosyltransferase involved in cell wall biosynthesis
MPFLEKLARFARKPLPDQWAAIKATLGRHSASVLREAWHLTMRTTLPTVDFFLPRPNPGVLFIGYVEVSPLGIGESLRGLIAAIAETKLPFAVYPYSLMGETRLIGPFMEDRYDRKGRYKVNVIEVTSWQVSAAFREMGITKTCNSYNILRTAWELSKAPIRWKAAINDIDEIWAPTEFVKEAFKVIFKGPIIVVPPCVEVKIQISSKRSYFELDKHKFYFLFSFDSFSFPARKNPLGVVRAFQAAFTTDENVGLIIKAVNANEKSGAPVLEAVRRDARIKVINTAFSRDEMLSLIHEADCYVSLHRSEGFGLGMAEAMALGKPVIGTNYSGNTDFLSDMTGFAVPYKLRLVEPGEYEAGAEGQSWAEPDETAAAEAIRRVFDDPRERQMRAAAGKAFVESRYSRRNVGKIAEQRLQEILALRRRL